MPSLLFSLKLLEPLQVAFLQCIHNTTYQMINCIQESPLLSQILQCQLCREENFNPCGLRQCWPLSLLVSFCPRNISMGLRTCFWMLWLLDLPCSLLSQLEVMLVVDATIQQLVLFKSFSKTLSNLNLTTHSKASATTGSIQSHAGPVEPSLVFSCISTRVPKMLLSNTKSKPIQFIQKNF